MTERFNVALVGGGPGGLAIMDMIPTDLLRQLQMNLIGVADVDPEAPGIKHAQTLGILTTTDYHDLFALKDLNLIVDQYLSFAELQARNHKPMYMNDWVKKLNDFMTLNDKEILEHAGQISSKMAKELAESEYEKYRVLSS